VGVIAAQSIGEPSTQLAMRQFHSGGIVIDPTKPIEASRFGQVEHLLKLTGKIPGSAVLSPLTGKITGVKRAPQGGFWVNIYSGRKGVGEKRVHVPQEKSSNLFKSIRAGGRLKKGDPMTSGPIHPLEVLDLKGAYAAQDSLVSQLYSLFKPVSPVKRKHFETVVRGMTSFTKVLDAKDSDWTPGQSVPLTHVKAYNAKAKKKDRVRHLPSFSGVNSIIRLSEDWIARLNSERIKETIIGAATQGWKSKAHGAHPIPPITFLGIDRIRSDTGFGRPSPSGLTLY
jgi:DNA-directed RNA polymerase subunit beta'